MRHGRTEGVLDITNGTVVQMIGWDEDCDSELLQAVTKSAGTEPVDGQYQDVVDTVVLWWRVDDGDLVDGLIDAMTLLAEGGSIWLLTPKPGRDGHVEAQEISDAGPTAGLRTTASISAGKEWNGTRLVSR